MGFFMGHIEAPQIALAKEEESIKVYGDFYSKFSVAKDVFLFLVREEQKHSRMIQKKY